MRPLTVTPRWGTWFLKWLDEPDPFEAFYIWKREMNGDHEWFELYCESDEYDITEVIDWYHNWCKQSLIIRLLYTLRFPDSIFYDLRYRLRQFKRYWRSRK